MATSSPPTPSAACFFEQKQFALEDLPDSATRRDPEGPTGDQVGEDETFVGNVNRTVADGERSVLELGIPERDLLARLGERLVLDDPSAVPGHPESMVSAHHERARCGSEGAFALCDATPVTTRVDAARDHEGAAAPHCCRAV